MIILTPAQANEVRGLTVRGHALAPVPLVNGNLVLPDAVLSDPYHRGLKAYIQANCSIVADSSIRQGTRTSIDSPLTDSDYELDPVKTARYAYRKEWPEGERIIVVP